MADDTTPQRTIRVPDEIWRPFLLLVEQTEQLSGAKVLTRWMQAELERYDVFWAPERPGSEVMVAFYGCEECNEPHRLDGAGTPWGCSVQKAYVDRQAKSTATAIQAFRRGGPVNGSETGRG